jgi:CheY-like chemotaxis protein
MGMKKILIVEDDQLVATAYRKRFKDAGWEVEWAADGVEGIKAVGTTRPDIVLLDLLMPRLDGIEVLKYIRANPDLRHLPVVVFSNSYMTNLIENAWRAGADQCLMKASTTPQALFDAIAKAMQKAAARKAEGAGQAAPALPTAAPRPSTPVLAPPLAPAAAGFGIVEPRRPAPPAGVRPSVVPPVQPLAYPGAAPAAAAPVAPLASVAPVAPAAPVLPPAPASPPQAPTGSTTPPFSVVTSPVPVVDPEFQAQIRQLFVAGAPAKIAAVRAAALQLAREPGAAVAEQVTNLFRLMHSLTGNAAVAGCTAIAEYASTFEAFLQELQQKPRFINASTLRTILRGLDFVSLLFRHALDQAPPDLARRILVVDGDPMSGQAISLTLEKAGLRTHLAGDPIEAMALASTETFDLVVAAADLPGMTGFEACAQLQTLPGCAGVPVLFVTSNELFETHANPEVLGENDLIARPFLIIELTLKASTLLETRRFQTYFAAAA